MVSWLPRPGLPHPPLAAELNTEFQCYSHFPQINYGNRCTRCFPSGRMIKRCSQYTTDGSAIDVSPNDVLTWDYMWRNGHLDWTHFQGEIVCSAGLRIVGSLLTTSIKIRFLFLFYQPIIVINRCHRLPKIREPIGRCVFCLPINPALIVCLHAHLIPLLRIVTSKSFEIVELSNFWNWKVEYSNLIRFFKIII